MAQELFYSPDNLGLKGAVEKAHKLCDDYDGTIVSVHANQRPKDKSQAYQIIINDGRPHYDSEYPKTVTLGDE